MSEGIPCFSDVGKAHDGSPVLAAGATRRGPPQVIPPRVTELMRVCVCRPYVDDQVRLIFEDRHLSSIVLPFSLFYRADFSYRRCLSLLLCQCACVCVCMLVCVYV